MLEGDRFVCVALRAERKRRGPPVTSKGIRNVPVNALIRSISMEYVHRVKKNPKGGGVVISPARVSGLKRLADAGPTEETLEHVALVYRLAYVCADRPTKAVEDAFRLPRSIAERWVSKARDLGLIDIPDPRRRK